MYKSPAQKLYDKAYAGKYRSSDEEEVLTVHHDRICRKLREISRSFGREITALDLGCGTGRYFHCLEGVNSLTGVDFSPHMLEQAKHPVREQEIRVAKMRLSAPI